MAALTADQPVEYKQGDIATLKVAAATEIFMGSVVNVNAAGYAVPGTDTAAETSGYVAQEYVNNTGAAGAKSIQCLAPGKVVNLDSPSTLAQANVGDKVYVDDDNTMSLVGDVTNNIQCGVIESFISASRAAVRLVTVGL